MIPQHRSAARSRRTFSGWNIVRLVGRGRIGREAIDTDGPELHQPPVSSRRCDRRITDNIARSAYRPYRPKTIARLFRCARQLFLQIVRPLARQVGGRDKRLACPRHEAVTDEGRAPVCGGEFEGVDAEVAQRPVARGRWLLGGQERLGDGMGAQECIATSAGGAWLLDRSAGEASNSSGVRSNSLKLWVTTSALEPSGRGTSARSPCDWRRRCCPGWPGSPVGSGELHQHRYRILPAKRLGLGERSRRPRWARTRRPP